MGGRIGFAKMCRSNSSIVLWERTCQMTFLYCLSPTEFALGKWPQGEAVSLK